MKLNEVKYTRRVNLGDYSHEELTISAVPTTEAVNAVQFSKELKETVLKSLSLAEEKEEVKAEPAKGEKVGNAPSAPATSAPSTEKRGRGRPVKNQDTATTASAPAASTSAPVAAQKPTTTNKKVIKYDRTVSFQADALATKLTELVPGWKDDPEKIKKAKLGSEKMKGEDFMDSADGVIFPSFMEKFMTVAGFESAQVSL